MSELQEKWSAQVSSPQAEEIGVAIARVQTSCPNRHYTLPVCQILLHVLLWGCTIVSWALFRYISAHV